MTRHICLFLLCHYSYQKRHIVAKTALDVLDGKVGVLDHVVEKGCNHGVGVEHQLLGAYRGYGYRVEDVRFARLSFLARMGMAGKLESIAYA